MRTSECDMNRFCVCVFNANGHIHGGSHSLIHHILPNALCEGRLKCGWQLTLYCFSFSSFIFLDIPPHAYTHTTIREHANIYHSPSVYIYVLKRKLQTSNTLPKMGLYNIYIDIKFATNEHRTHGPKCSVSFLFHELRYIYYWA